jgi:hypothetical protein
LTHSLEKILEDGTIEIASDFLNALSDYFEKIGADLELKRSIIMLNRFETMLETYFSKIDASKEDQADSQLALLEVWSVSVMSAPLGFYKFWRGVNTESFVKDFEAINYQYKEELYKKRLPPLVLNRLEYIQSRLRRERAIEGNVVSPFWYIRQLIISRYIDLCKESVDELVASLENFFIKKSEFFLSKKLFMSAALLSKRGLESCSKMQAHFPVIADKLNKLGDVSLVIKDIPCSKTDWEVINNKILEAHDKLVQIQAKCLPALSLLKKQKTMPDVFGQTYNTVCQEVYRSLADNKEDKFKALFPLLFFGAIMASENLKIDLRDRDVEVLISIVSEPLLDLLYISGYAKIYSELYGKPAMWAACTVVWDKYLKENTDKKSFIQKFVGLQEHRKTQFKIFPRDYLRTNWETEMRRRLKEMNIIDDMMGFASDPWSGKTIKHESYFIKALCRGRFLYHVSAADVFILTYLMKLPEAVGIEFKDYSQLNDAIEEEKNKEAKGQNGEKK